MNDTTRTGRPAIGPKIQVRFPEQTITALDERAAALGVDRTELIRQYVSVGLDRPVYTVQVEVCGAAGVWQAIAPAETIETAPNETAEDIARWTAQNQAAADGDGYRVLVWAGSDTSTDPAYVLHGEDA